MTIDEAIEIKGRTWHESLDTNIDDIHQADRLSIEALKLIRILRALGILEATLTLPFETKEIENGRTNQAH